MSLSQTIRPIECYPLKREPDILAAHDSCFSLPRSIRTEAHNELLYLWS